jgi:hypothetical protein
MTMRFCLAGMCVLLLAASAGAEPRGDLKRAAAEPDPARRAEAVLPYLDAADGLCYGDVLDIWAGCGKAANPVLRQLAADEGRPDRATFVDALVRAAGKEAIPDLERLLRQERTYWNNLGLNLDEESKVSSARFQCLIAILGRLDELGYRDGQGLVRSIRARFDDHPILRRYGTACKGELSPVVAVADAILARD